MPERDTVPLCHLPRLSQALDQTAAQVRRSQFREAWSTLAARWLALAAVLFLLDVVFALPAALRWAALIAQAALLAWSLAALLCACAQARISAERAARLLEERYPELDNALIHAVQFSHASPVARRGSDGRR